MFKKITLAALILIISAVNIFAADEPAHPQNFVVAEIPIFSQKLRFKLPTDWQHAHTSQNDNSYLIEFIPKDEDIKNWKNLFSIQAFKDFDPTVSPEDIANNVANNFAKDCPQNSIYNKIGEQVLDGYDAFEAIIGCAALSNDHATNLKKGMSEISYYIFIKGQKDLYFAQKSIRGAGFPFENFPDSVKKSIDEIKNHLPIEFCNLDSAQGKCQK
ncbi:MAG: hypothetical protein COB24_14520 [Hyphomicrobiales bacterium]|nr:MAG: hypothetical protein COB24_14520 [Hyphomicrobiales bacterium]